MIISPADLALIADAVAGRLAASPRLVDHNVLLRVLGVLSPR